MVLLMLALGTFSVAGFVLQAIARAVLLPLPRRPGERRLWGGLHGAYLAIHKFWLARRGRRPDVASIARVTPGAILGIAGTFLLVDFAWIFFRCSSLAETIGFLQGIFTFRGGWENPPWGLLGTTLFYAGLTFFTDLPDYAANRQERMLDWPWLARSATYAAMLFLLIMLRPLDDTPFIYFQF